jgi:large subunit ribosomal protein L13e
MPIVKPVSADIERAVGTSEVKAYATLRKAQSDKKLKGIREQRAKAKAEEEAQKKK